MNKALFLVLMAFSASVFAEGPNVSNGPAATQNLSSKKKIQAVMDAITGANEVVESVALDAGKVLYIAKVSDNGACSESFYKVEPDNSSVPGQYIARFVNLISAGPCE